MMTRKTTVTIPENSLRQNYLRKRKTGSNDKELANTFSNIILVIRGVTEIISLTPLVPFYLGRYHPKNKTKVNLDLSPYGAGEYGVSRVHACLEVNFHDQLYVTDLQSTNGTILNGEPIKPYSPELICGGDELILGNLLIKFNLGLNNANESQ